MRVFLPCDDFCGVELAELAGVAFNRIAELFEELGLKASPAKDQLPNTQMLVLGIWFNTGRYDYIGS